MEKFFEAIRKNDIETVESMIQSGQDEALGHAICSLHDRLRLVTAVLDRIDENRD